MTLNAKMLVVAVEVTVDDIVLVAVTCASDHCLNEHDGKDPKQHDTTLSQLPQHAFFSQHGILSPSVFCPFDSNSFEMLYGQEAEEVVTALVEKVVVTLLVVIVVLIVWHRWSPENVRAQGQMAPNVASDRSVRSDARSP